MDQLDSFKRAILSRLPSAGRTSLKGLEGNSGARNIYVTGYPISGNSWVAYLVSYVLNRRYWDIDATEWSAQRTTLRGLLSGENSHPSSKRYDAVLKTHASPLELPVTSADVVVYVVRDVKDVANSYFHRVERTWPTSPDWRRRLLYTVGLRPLPLGLRYRLMIQREAKAWANHVRSGIACGAVHVVRYEDFLDKPYESLELLIRRLDAESWDPIAAESAIELFSFQSVKKAAAESLPDPTQRTDRVGGAGDWQNYFSDADTMWFEREYGALLREIEILAASGQTVGSKN